MTSPPPSSHCTIAVIGSRCFRDYRLMCDTLDKLIDEWRGGENVPPIQVKFVSGGAQGADKMAERYARENDLVCDVLKPEWRDAQGKYNPRAGLERNTQIVDRADRVVAFWDGVSTGTRDSIRKAEKRGIDVKTVKF